MGHILLWDDLSFLTSTAYSVTTIITVQRYYTLLQVVNAEIDTMNTVHIYHQNYSHAAFSVLVQVYDFSV